MAQEFKEKTINVNLRRVFEKPATKRATAALFALKEAVKKETRKTDVSLSQGVNRLIWERGLYNAPRRMTVKVVADEKDKNACRAYLPDEKIAEKKEKKAETKRPEKKGEEKKEDGKAEEKGKAAAAAGAPETKKEPKAQEAKKDEKKAPAKK